MGVRGDVGGRNSVSESVFRKGAMVSGARVYDAPLLPFERQLIDAIGSTEEEYRYFVAETIWKGRIRPASYENIPDIQNTLVGEAGALTLLGQIVVGVTLTAIGILLTPKPRQPKQIKGQRADDINNAGRFTPTHGFDTLSEIADYGSPIPIIFGRYRSDDKDGGMLVTPRLVWSQMKSLGRQQLAKLMFVVGEQGAPQETYKGIKKPDVAGIFIGNNQLVGTPESQFAFYWKRSTIPTTGRQQFRIHTENKAYGTCNPYVDGQNSDNANDDILLVTTGNAAKEEGFSSAHSPSNTAQFGCYSPIRNGTPLKLNWRVIPIPHVLDRNDDDPKPYRLGYGRWKIAGSKGVFTQVTLSDGTKVDRIDYQKRQAHNDGKGKPERNGMPGLGRLYSCRMGILKYRQKTGDSSSGPTFGAWQESRRTADPGNGLWVPRRTITGVKRGDQILFVIRKGTEQIGKIYFDNKGATVDDINSKVNTFRKQADDAMQLGEEFQIGRCLWKVTNRTLDIWKVGDPESDDNGVNASTDQEITLECIDHNQGLNNTVGLVALALIAPTRTGAASIPNLRKQDGSARRNWTADGLGSGSSGKHPGPLDGTGFIGDDPQFGTVPGTSWYPLLKIEKAIVRNSRPCSCTEIGFKSIVYQQLNGLCNFQSIPTIGELKDTDHIGVRMESGFNSSYIRRASCFEVRWRIAGSSEDSWGGWSRLDADLRFVIIGSENVAQYHFLKFQHKGTLVNKKIEFQICPLNGGDMRKLADTAKFYLLRARSLSKSDNNALQSRDLTNFKVHYHGEIVEKSYIKNNPEFYSRPSVTTTGGGSSGDPTEITKQSFWAERNAGKQEVKYIKELEFAPFNGKGASQKTSGNTNWHTGGYGAWQWEMFGTANGGVSPDGLNVQKIQSNPDTYRVTEEFEASEKPVRIRFTVKRLKTGASGDKEYFWWVINDNWRWQNESTNNINGVVPVRDGDQDLNQGWSINNLISIVKSVASGNPWKDSRTHARVKVKVTDVSTNMGIVQGKRFGFNYEIFGNVTSATKTVAMVINSSNSNLGSGKTIKLKFKGKRQLLQSHWSGETKAWVLDEVEVDDSQDPAGNWSKGNEFIVKEGITSDNPFRNAGSGKVGVVLKVDNTEETPTVTVIEGNRLFEGHTQYSDMTLFDGFVTKSNQSSPEHVVTYVNEIIDNDDGDEDFSPGYNKLATAALVLKAGRNYNSLEQVRFWLDSGIPVKRLTASANRNDAYGDTNEDGPSSLITDLVNYMLTDETGGISKSLGGGVSASYLIDRSQMQQTAKFLVKNHLYFNGVIGDAVNVREYISGIASSFLCDFCLSDGKFTLTPALPMTSTGEISQAAITPKQIFTAGNILEDSFSINYLSAEERQPFIASVRWRKEVKNQLPEEQVEVIQYKDFDEDISTIETYDMTAFCTSQTHARLFGKFALAVRDQVTHIVNFKTTPYGLNLAPGDYIKITTAASPYTTANNGTVASDGTITSVRTMGNGKYKVAYYQTGSETDVITDDMTVSSGKVTEVDKFKNSFFSVVASTDSSTIYKVQELTIEEDCTVAISAIEFPCNSSNKSLIASIVKSNSNFNFNPL